MSEIIKNILSNIELQGPFFLRNSIMYTIKNVSWSGRDSLSFTTLDDFIPETIKFRDSGNQNGVEVFNHSDSNLFIFESQLLKAGHQDRVTLVSSLIGSKESRVLLPVACVERGRNSGNSKYFQYGSLGFPSLRQEISKSIRRYPDSTPRVRVDQQRIWKFIDKSLSSLNVQSHTRSINDLYDQEEAEIIRYTDNISFQEDSIGCLFVLGKRLMLDIFHPNVFCKINKKLLHGYVLEMLLHGKYTNDPGEYYLMNWIGSVISKGKSIRAEGVDLGENIKIENGTSCGNGLAHNHDLLCFSLYN